MDTIGYRSKMTLTSIMVLFLLLGWNTAVWGEETKREPSPEVAPEMTEEKLPEKVQPPVGYVPGISAPDLYGTLGLGPTAGVLAPYGNPVAYDSLQRGWRSFRVGKVNLTPYFAVEGLYRSNIFLTPSDKKSDFIMVLSPGLRAEIPIAGRHRLSVGYLGTGFIYTGFTEQSHYDQNVNVDMTLNFKGGTSLRFGNTFRSATEEINSEFAQRRNYWRTTPYLTITRAFADRWKLQGAYQFDTLVFTNGEDDINDFDQHNVAATLFYRFWPKTSALIEYIFTYRGYPSFPRDNNYTHSPLVGLTWDPTAKLTGTMKFGYTFKQYETDLSGRNNSPENFIMVANLLYRYSRYTNLTVTAQRAFFEDVDFDNSAYRSTGVWVSLNHDWHYFRVYSYATFFYMNNDYVSPSFDAGNGEFLDREDNIIGVGLGLSRPINRWLRARIDYFYSNRSSNFAGYTYNDHRLLFGVSTSF